MKQLQLIPDSNNDEQTPLPLIVAQRWNFPLAHSQTENGIVYAVQDWMRGLSGEEKVSNLWSMFKKTEAGKQTYNSIVTLPYKASDGKSYKRDYVNDKGLYLIAQYMRVKHDRPVLTEIRQFLAAAGAFVDMVRLEPDAILDTVKDPDKLLEAFVAYHRKRGKDDDWIDTRIQSTISRLHFTRALTEFVLDVLTRKHYATATNDVYEGLWGRSAATLKTQLKLGKNDNLRDNQPSLGLQYQAIVEEVCALKLGETQEIHWEEARDIIQTVAKLIGQQAQQTSDLLKMDIATGKRLLASG
jgi:hypothetical protein